MWELCSRIQSTKTNDFARCFFDIPFSVSITDVLIDSVSRVGLQFPAMRYLVRIKDEPVTLALTYMDAQVGSYNRNLQIEKASTLSETVDSRSHMADRLSEFGISFIAHPVNQTPISGIAVIEGNAEDVSELGFQFSEYEIIADTAINLIRPEYSQATVVDDGNLDLWHLDKVFNTKRRENNGGDGVRVAVLDTGVTEVQEIQGRISGHQNLDVNTWQVLDAPLGDTDGHGTHVSGLVYGETIGIAPGAQVESVNMLPGGRGTISNFILAMEWVAAQPEISILNMSAGIPGYQAGMNYIIEILERLGVLTVIATGNEGVNRTRSPGNYISPISVGASNQHNQIASFSSGADMLIEGVSYTIPDLVAPGEKVTSCVMQGGYEMWSGTSMATPIVSGIAALHIQNNPQIKVTELRDKLIYSCIDLGFNANRQGAGLIQI